MTHMYGQLNKVEIAELLAAEESELGLDRFDHDDAWAVGSRLAELGRERGLGIAIRIDFGDQRVFHAALPGTSAENDDWLGRKARTVRYYERSSLAVKYLLDAQGETLASKGLDDTLFAAAGGGFPLRVGGRLVGFIGVSGLEMHDDHALIVEVLRERGAA